jgi:phenylpyruvate tautomerase PptA (4-oxalocrotonate tautomerase family)
MPDIYCEWNNDLIVTPKGGIVTATGWDRVRQRIIRHLITNSAQKLPDGTTTAPDYIFHPTYGIGAGSLVGQNPTQSYKADLIARINQAALSDAAVDPGSAPIVVFREPQPGTWVVHISVKLRDGTVGRTGVRVS